MEPISRDKVLQLVKSRGPVIPNDLRKALGLSETMLLGALLSELSSKGLVKVSKTKLGGSPFYYDPANPASLERISQHLGEKDKRAYDLLKEKKVLRDDQQEALVRVCLRNLKDYAVPLTVNTPDGTTTYWKYYLVSDADAEQLIRRDLGLATNKPAAPKPATTAAAPQQTTANHPSTPTTNQATNAPTTSHRPAATQASTEAAQPAKTRPANKATTPTSKPRTSKPADEQAKLPPAPLDDEFYTRVKAFCDQHGIEILEHQLIRKKRELDLIIKLPTPVGKVEYYCKAKAKKKSNDGDLAAAKLQGQSKGLPVLYLTTGEVTKKAREKLATDFKGVVVQALP